MRGLSTTPEAAPGTQVAGGGGGFGRGGGPDAGVWDHGLGGCESGFTIPDPTDFEHHLGDLLWDRSHPLRLQDQAGPFGQPLAAHARLGAEQAQVPGPLDPAPGHRSVRPQHRVYFGAQVIFKTTNGGASWSVISPDLSTQDPRRIVSSGGIVGDNLGQFYGEVVFSIAPSEIQKGLIWAGTNDGKVWNTKDGGGSWNDVTKNIVGLPALGRSLQDRAVPLRRRHGLHRRRFSSDGQPRSVALQDDGSRSDLDQDHRRSAERHARLCPGHRREPEPQGDAIRGHGQRALLLDG